MVRTMRRTACAQVLITLREHYDMDKDEAKHLTHNYGTRALQVGSLSWQRVGSRYSDASHGIVHGGQRRTSRAAASYGPAAPPPALPIPLK